MVGGEQMRQVVIRAPGQIEITTAEVPALGPGNVLVETSVVGLCGSDFHATEGKHPFVELPYFPGHEVAGVVAAVGPEVTGFSPGDRVLVEPNVVCGVCEHCRSGRYNLCARLAVFGFQIPGALADKFTIPVDRLHAVPQALTDAQAALVEPLSTVMHAIRVAGDLAGRRVAILGAGSIGLLTLVAARAEGAVAVAVTDLQADKLDRARRLGATVAFDPRRPEIVHRMRDALGGRPDYTFDCVSNQASIEQAIALAHKGGSVIVVGVATGTVSIPLPIIQDGEIRIEGSAMYVRQDVERAIEFIAADKLPVEEVVTATFPLEQVAAAFAAAQDGAQVKVQIEVRKASTADRD